MKFLLTACILLPYIISTAHAGKICKWEENGQVHYGECSSSPKASEIKIKPGKTLDQSAQQRREKQQRLLDSLTQDRRDKEKTLAKKRKQKKKLKRDCTIARDNLTQYQRASRLYTRDEGGNRQYLSDKQKQQEEARLKQAITKQCK